MKKRVALFANGWTAENLVNFINGLVNDLKKESVDIYLFTCYSSYGMDPTERKAESMIYALPKLDSFDAAVIFGPGLNFSDDIEMIFSSIEKAKIPAISIGLPHDSFTCISVDNHPGMYDLCKHMIEVHEATDFAYIAGSSENADSNQRLFILRECMSDHGLDPDSIDIHYTNWEVGNCKAEIDKIIASGHLPDAIICANDQLAMHSIVTLKEGGITVPDQVFVSGFDNIAEGENFYPAITTVDQCYERVGKQAALRLSAILNGDKSIHTDLTESSFVPKESCGCNDFDGDMARRHYAYLRPYSIQKNYGITGRLFSLEQAILKSQSYDELSNNLKHIFNNSNGSEGDTFYIMLDPAFEDIGSDIPLPAYRFGDEFNVTVGKFRSVPTKAGKVSRKDIIPESDIIPENCLYTMVPLYYEAFLCGYIIFGDALASISAMDLYLFNNRVNRILMFLKRNVQLKELNIKLSELMDQDALTRVKNRTAYEKYLKNLEADFIEGENKPFAVIYFDINNLKMINDMYGHEKGDTYIKNSCRLICNTFKHSPVFRIGGDEFVSIAQNDDYEKRHELLSGMREHMKVLKEKGDSVPLTERISIASGMAEYDRTLDEDFSSIFKRADELMYENKYNMKNPG